MKRIVYIACFVVSVIGFAQLTSRTSVAQTNDGRLDAAGLKAAVEGLGYETKDIGTGVGKEKYEFKIEKSDLNIPVGAEVSPSKNYIWLTVFLGNITDKHNPSELLKRNAKIQPSFFYVTAKGALMMAAPIDNRLVTSAVMRRVVDKLTSDVSDTKDVWQIKQ